MDYVETGAIFSTDRRHRYALWRRWTRDLPALAFIGFNPSTADETKDDATIRRVVGFATRWGYGSLYMVNLFSFCATHPDKLVPRKLETLTNDENDFWLDLITRCCDKAVIGWGALGALHGRSDMIRRQYKKLLWCLGTTKNGEPFHPLYRPNATKLRPFNAR